MSKKKHYLVIGNVSYGKSDTLCDAFSLMLKNQPKGFELPATPKIALVPEDEKVIWTEHKVHSESGECPYLFLYQDKFTQFAAAPDMLVALINVLNERAPADARELSVYQAVAKAMGEEKPQTIAEGKQLNLVKKAYSWLDEESEDE